MGEIADLVVGGAWQSHIPPAILEWLSWRDDIPMNFTKGDMPMRLAQEFEWLCRNKGKMSSPIIDNVHNDLLEREKARVNGHQ